MKNRLRKTGKDFILYISSKKDNFGFTLVELIIVITILSILAVIAFSSFQNYIKDSRDANRIATLTNLQKGLELLSIKVNKYPNPEDVYASGSVNGEELFEVGYIKEMISKMANFSKTLTDPTSNGYYIYGVSHDKKYYQIATILENLQTNNILPTTYASIFSAYVIGNYKGILLKGGKIYNPASLILPYTGETDLTNPTYFVQNGEPNLPYKLYSDMILTGGIAKVATGIDINTIKEGWGETYSGNIQQIFGVPTDIVGSMIYGEKKYFTEIKQGENLTSGYSSSGGGENTTPWACGDLLEVNISGTPYNYKTKTMPDGRCWTADLMTHKPIYGTDRTGPDCSNASCPWADDSYVILNGGNCRYNNPSYAANCPSSEVSYGLYTWLSAMGGVDADICTTNGNEDCTETSYSVCKQLGSNWRLPTHTEWETLNSIGECQGWTSLDANKKNICNLIDSLPGIRATNGGLVENGTYAFLWSSTKNTSTHSRDQYLSFNTSTTLNNPDHRRYGFSVVCIQD